MNSNTKEGFEHPPSLKRNWWVVPLINQKFELIAYHDVRLAKGSHQNFQCLTSLTFKSNIYCKNYKDKYRREREKEGEREIERVRGEEREREQQMRNKI